jgi:hypothetical protein
VTPQFRLDPSGGQVMITRFECPNRVTMLVVALLHERIKRDVRRRVPGYLGAVMVRDWRRRTVLSVTLWDKIESVYGMGGVDRHIEAARVPARLGIDTRCGVFCYAGDWREVMFHSTHGNPSPLAEP